MTDKENKRIITKDENRKENSCSDVLDLKGFLKRLKKHKISLKRFNCK